MRIIYFFDLWLLNYYFLKSLTRLALKIAPETPIGTPKAAIAIFSMPSLDVQKEEVCFWVYVDLIQYIPQRVSRFGTNIAKLLHDALLEKWVLDGASSNGGSEKQGGDDDNLEPLVVEA